MVKVSVIMPVYNTHETYLRQAIESVLAQTFTDFEFIIVDDCPEHSMKDIVESYADDRIRFYQNEKNIGIAKNYNKLISLAKGQYIAVMNHDDISLPKRLEREVKFLDSHPEVGVVGTGYKKFGEYNRFRKIFNPKKDAEIRALLLFKSVLHHPTIMFRSDLVREYQIIYDPQFISLNDRKFYQDLGKVSKFYNIQEILYKYRFHPNMTSKISHDDIVKEQYLFHSLFFAYYDVDITRSEKEIFDNYITCGRCRINSYDVLVKIQSILEKLVGENAYKHFMPEPEFSRICGLYLVKKCRNAAIFGRINSTHILQTTTLPIKVPTSLELWNNIIFWRKVA